MTIYLFLSHQSFKSNQKRTVNRISDVIVSVRVRLEYSRSWSN